LPKTSECGKPKGSRNGTFSQKIAAGSHFECKG
jgi:hypothetical protein